MLSNSVGVYCLIQDCLDDNYDHEYIDHCFICDLSIPTYRCPGFYRGESPAKDNRTYCWGTDCFYNRNQWEYYEKWSAKKETYKWAKKENKGAILRKVGKCKFKVKFLKLHICQNITCKDAWEWWLQSRHGKSFENYINITDEFKSVLILTQYLKYAAERGGKLWTRNRKNP